MKKYDIYLPIVARVRKNLDELSLVNPEILNELLNQYLSKSKLE